MKILTLRSSVALACALSLAACGGGSGNLLLAGTISGLNKPGLVLKNKSETLTIDPTATTFTFTQLLKNDEDFDVEVATQPQGAICTPHFNTGKTGSYNITSVAITCLTNKYNLGGTVTGLDADGLVLVNGVDRLAVPKAKDGTTIKFSQIEDGALYGITVLTQPAGRTCTVQNGVGTMGSADISTILVTCV